MNIISKFIKWFKGLFRRVEVYKYDYNDSQCSKELGFGFADFTMGDLEAYTDGISIDGDLQRIGISITAI